MRIIGIDPGTHRIGWAIVDGTPNHSAAVAYDCIDLPPHTTTAEYLVSIQSRVDALLTKYQPDRAGIEALFVQKNLKTATSVAEARGVILYTFAKHRLPWTELSPNSVKSAVAGSGKAGKREVEKMVGLLLKIDTKKLLDDTTDALAIALAAQVVK